MGKREEVVKIMQGWVGAKKGDTTHHYIVDNYNKINPLPRGYKLKYSDAWCAGTVSSAYHSVGLDNIFPSEVSCTQMINKAKKMGIWQENDAYVPKVGDCLIYDWDDNGKGDCVGQPEHVGMVEKVSNGKMTIIEGNMGKSSVVGRRTVNINGQFIRGFVTPKIDGATNSTPTENKAVESPKNEVKRRQLMFGCKGADVKELHKVLRTFKYGVSADNEMFDMLTKSCVIHFQTVNKLKVDGIVGEQTYKALGM